MSTLFCAGEGPPVEGGWCQCDHTTSQSPHTPQKIKNEDVSKEGAEEVCCEAADSRPGL